MLEKVKDSFNTGVERLRWFSTVLNDRVKVEIAMVRLMREVRDLEMRREALLRAIGSRVLELRHGTLQLMEDERIRRSVVEIEGIERDIASIKEKASELGSIE